VVRGVIHSPLYVASPGESSCIFSTPLFTPRRMSQRSDFLKRTPQPKQTPPFDASESRQLCASPLLASRNSQPQARLMRERTSESPGAQNNHPSTPSPPTRRNRASDIVHSSLKFFPARKKVTTLFTPSLSHRWRSHGRRTEGLPSGLRPGLPSAPSRQSRSFASRASSRSTCPIELRVL
jgi:hypothetical protein